jgi:hypothetical protein
VKAYPAQEEYAIDRPIPDGPVGRDGFVSLSYRENFGYSFAEALAYGLPAIVSSGHDLAHDIVGPYKEFSCGWLLDGDARSQAVAAIREWATALAGRLTAAGAAGRAWVSDELAFDRFRERLKIRGRQEPSGYRARVIAVSSCVMVAASAEQLRASDDSSTVVQCSAHGIE